MANSSEGGDLAAETGEEARVRNVNALDRDLLPGFSVCRTVDNAHPARAQAVEHPISAERELAFELA